MRIVKVSSEFYSLCKDRGLEKELMYNEQGRPCVLLLNLKYKNKEHRFVIPMRSNISPTAKKWQYFSLPPNPKTKPRHHHGIHYIKMFPISSNYIEKYHIENNKYYLKIQQILDKNERNIIEACQNYLYECEQGKKHFMTPDIDGILEMLDKEKSKIKKAELSLSEVAATLEQLTVLKNQDVSLEQQSVLEQGIEEEIEL